MFTIPNNRCQKSWSIYVQRRWKRVYQWITVQLDKPPSASFPCASS